jgi:lysyl endopeptidase
MVNQWNGFKSCLRAVAALSSAGVATLVLGQLPIAEPADLALGLAPLSEAQRIELPPLDLPEVQGLDESRKELGLPPIFAIPHNVKYTTETHGTWEQVGTQRVWRLRVRSQGAHSLNFGITEFHLPATAVFSVYNQDQTELYSFTSADNNVDRELWTPVVNGDDITLQIAVDVADAADLAFALTSINHDFRGFGKTLGRDDDEKSGSCNVDVVCAQGNQWRKQIRSVAVMSRNGRTFCTGAMVNNTSNDLRPFFLTAYHCGVRANNAASLVVYWNYENSSCRTPGSPSSGRSGDGRRRQFTSGSQFRAGNSASDFALVEFNQKPKKEFRVYYSGWDARPATPQKTTGIHHPGTDEKRISFDFDKSNITGYLGRAGDTHVEVKDWDVGTTEPGSSGSPLYDQNQRIVGQLHGGWAACGNDREDYYGRVHVSWLGGGSNSTSLKPWLDHAGTGKTFVDGLDSPKQ